MRRPITSGDYTGTANSDMSKNRTYDFRFKYINNISMLFEIMVPDVWGIHPAIIASEFSVPI
jgi:hypothetical protein